MKKPKKLVLKTKTFSSRLGKLSASPKGLLLFAIAFAGVGSALFILTHAATPTTSIEPENKTIISPAITGSDNNASGGQYVQFKAGGGGVICDRTASGAALQTVVSQASAGQTVCFSGSYLGNLSLHANIRIVGPGTITGLISISRTSTNVTLQNLTLVGTGDQVTPLQVNASDFTLADSDVTNNKQGQACMTLGGSYASYGRADNALIENNRFHDCGYDTHFHHDMYVEGSTGFIIRNNTITGAADWGIHLYPDADNGLVSHNTITGNGGGVIFAGQSPDHSDNNQVSDNIIANSSVESNIDVYDVGTGNSLINNCIYSPASGHVNISAAGVTVSGTTTDCTGKGIQ